MASHSTFLLSALFFSAAVGLAQDTKHSGVPITATPNTATPNTATVTALENGGRRPKVVSPAANPQNAALLALKNEQVALWEAEIQRLLPYTAPEYEEVLKSQRERAQAIEKATGDAAFDFVPLQERAYFAENDGSPQPYYVMLPNGYTPQKKWPLIVFLHGYSTLISKINPWIPLPEVLQAAAKRGFIFVIPYGRRNSDFVDWGEDDVRAVRDDVRQHFSVDDTRMHLLGASMGAFGAYAIDLHAPGEWTSVAPISGRTDMFLWFKTSRDQLPAWKRVLLEADDPRTLILNARHTPFYIQHGALDRTVPVDHARRFISDASLFGLPVRYQEEPFSDHESLFQLPAYERAYTWFEMQKPTAPPRQFSFTTGNGWESRGYWAQIEAFENYERLARIDIKLEAAIIEVKTSNVARFVLKLPPALWPQQSKLALSVNGTPVGTYDVKQPIAWQTPNAKLDKFPGRVGPFKNLMRAPFLLVYGNEADEQAAARFATEWQVWTDGVPAIKAAANISQTDKATFNLLLFGTRATNPLLRDIGDQLPLELTPTGYRIGNKQVQAKNVGLRMVWKAPWNPKRLVGVCSGLWWGEKLPPNHKWDWIPDYIVYGTETEPDPDHTNRALEAGWFDGNWSLTTEKALKLGHQRSDWRPKSKSDRNLNG